MFLGHGKWYDSIERIRRFLGGAPSRVQVAALPYRIRLGEIEILLVTSRDTGRWVLPKGWVEAGEKLPEAAGREALEEGGVRGVVADHEAGHYYYEKARNSGFRERCVVMVYPLAVDSVLPSWAEEEQRERRWFSPVEAAKAVREPDLAELLAKFEPAE